MNRGSSQDKNMLDPNRWVNTLPGKNLINSISALDSISTPTHTDSFSIQISSSNKKYPITIILFLVGLILVTLTKNEARNLQREISNLKASINTLKNDLHQASLEHEVITSPESISQLANEYLESDFTTYKKSQINQLTKKEKTLTILSKTKKTPENKNKLIANKIKLKVAKKIETTKTELKKLQDLYSSPKQLPDEIRIRVAQKIEIKKNELQNLYSNPYDLINSKKAKKWVGIQVVKAFLGMPIIPGK